MWIDSQVRSRVVRMADAPLSEYLDRQPAVRQKFQFVVGMGWLAAVASAMAQITRGDFWWIFAATIGAAVAFGGAAVAWLARWASRPEGRLGQFGIGFLLAVTAFAAAYLGFIRWLVAAAHAGGGPPVAEVKVYVGLGIFGLIPLAVTCFVALHLVDSLLAWAVWLMRRLRGAKGRS